MTSKKSNHIAAVEVDGIRFETLVPERLLTVQNVDGAKTPVQFGLRVTNMTSTPYRFIFFHLLLELLELDGQVIHMDYACNSIRLPTESDFLLAMPGESLTYFIDADFYWLDHNVGIAGHARDGRVWAFGALKPGIYRVRFTYENKSAVRQIYRGVSREGFWIGIVPTPLVDIRLTIYI